MVRIRCHKTGNVFKAVESFTASTADVTVDECVYGDYSEEEYIALHDLCAEKPNPSTGLPKKWVDETPERRDMLIQFRFGRKLISKETVIQQRPCHSSLSGYYVVSSTGGNADRGWAKIFTPESVDVL